VQGPRARLMTQIREPRKSKMRYEDSSFRRFFSHRALAALRAIAHLSSAESFSARAFPPFLPPSLPKLLCHNICVLIQAIHELGIEPNFCAEFRPAQKYPLNG
jgi:hypothetical protein